MHHGGNAIEKASAMGLHVTDEGVHRIPDRNLAMNDQGLHLPQPACGFLHGASGGRTIEIGDPLEPLRARVRMRRQPRHGRFVRIAVLVENRAHELALELDREREIPQQLHDVRTLLRVAGPNVGMNGRAAEIRSEHRIAAAEIAHIEAQVHRMRCPAQKHDRPVRVDGALDLRQHALLARFDDLEVPEAEGIGVDHAENEAVAVVAGLDAVDRVIQFGGEFADIGEVAQAGLVGVGRHGEGVLGAAQI